MGVTKYWDEFMTHDGHSGNAKKTDGRILFGKTWEETIINYNVMSNRTGLEATAIESFPKGIYDIKNKIKIFIIIVEIMVFSLVVANLEGCAKCKKKINHWLGERKVELNVKNSQGTYTPIFLKTNGEIVTISENPDMKYIGMQENSAINYEPVFIYKNTDDTLYLVWWSSGSGVPQIETEANIHFIYEPSINPELVQKYQSLGFTKFPEYAYN